MTQERLMTRLIRDADRVWLLEFTCVTDPELFYRLGAGELNGLLKLLEQTKARKLVIELTSADNFDSRGLQLLIMLYKQVAPQNIAIGLRHPSPYLCRVLRIMQLEQMFEIEADKNQIEMK